MPRTPTIAADDPDPASRVLEVRALFDVRFEEAGIAVGIQAQSRRARKAGLAHGVGQRGAATVGRAVLDLARQCADERAAAEAPDEARLLVLERHGVDRQGARRSVGGQRAHDFEPVDHAERAVEPASGRLRVGVRADQQGRARGT